MSSSKK
ncbi:unnamed protein product [Linum tenue]|nr:unnamed protein product [Linum tenue]CAI0428585.1 unnamed protein product [Linum tenue]